MTVSLITTCVFALALASPNDQSQIEKYENKMKTYKLQVPGNEPITIIETAEDKDLPKEWEEISIDPEKGIDHMEMKNLMTDIIHDPERDTFRCYGPSCQEGFDASVGPQDAVDETYSELDQIKDYRDFSSDRLQAIQALAAKLKKQKIKADRFSSLDDIESEEDDSKKVYTSWNRLKVKQHKHPFDDKDGWVTLEPVAWSTSKVSKWKPNVKKQKPNHWIDNIDRFPSDNKYNYNQDSEETLIYPQNRPSNRPSFINNKFHNTATQFEVDPPSKPSWNKYPHNTYNYPTSWSPDEGRRPQKPNCDDEAYSNEDTMLYGSSDSVMTDKRPSNYPYQYEALHQSSYQKRPIRRPTQVVYAGSPETDGDRASKPHGDGQWVLLSTTKGYRTKKRQRSLTDLSFDNPVNDRPEGSSMTSHQAIALTVLPADSAHKNMTTSHGGLLEVEKSFQTVEESKRDMDKMHDMVGVASQLRPSTTKVIKRKIFSSGSPDSSSILAAVGAGMVPATMAMVVPMMLGRKKRDLANLPGQNNNQGVVFRREW